MESISCHEAVPGNKVFNCDLVKPDKLRVHDSVQSLEENIVLILTTGVVRIRTFEKPDICGWKVGLFQTPIFVNTEEPDSPEKLDNAMQKSGCN